MTSSCTVSYFNLLDAMDELREIEILCKIWKIYQQLLLEIFIAQV